MLKCEHIQRWGRERAAQPHGMVERPGERRKEGGRENQAVNNVGIKKDT